MRCGFIISNDGVISGDDGVLCGHSAVRDRQASQAQVPRVDQISGIRTRNKLTARMAVLGVLQYIEICYAQCLTSMHRNLSSNHPCGTLYAYHVHPRLFVLKRKAEGACS